MDDVNKQNQDEQLAVPSQHEFPADSYPQKYVHSVFDAQQDAAQAVQALKTAGYDTEDIHFMMSQSYEQAVQQGNQQRSGGTLSRFASSLDYGLADVYLNEARRGRHILSVRISNHDQIMQVRDILFQHHGQLIKYVDTWTQANLSDSVTHGDW